MLPKTEDEKRRDQTTNIRQKLNNEYLEKLTSLEIPFPIDALLVYRRFRLFALPKLQ
jgi:hypothetical protein